ncbi:MAG TPA: aquaporin [Chloroflexota bacterium]|nr:aquaporin [Chloroflexota bacterium]
MNRPEHDIAPRRLLAELLGTAALTVAGGGAAAVSAINGGIPDFTAQMIVPGLLVMAMIYTIGPVSGAHINPVVTLAFALRQDFPWRRVPGYWLAQLAGAVLGALLLRGLFGHAAHGGATLPHHGNLTSMVVEVILTFLLVTVILAVSANARVVGHNAAIVVGATIILDGLFAGGISGASMNPARSFGPAVVAGETGSLWIYLIGPLLGSLAAVIVAGMLRGGTNPDARAAATGTP